MKSQILIFAVSALLGGPGWHPAVAQSKDRPARLVEEYGDINYEDEIARLDNFAIQLQNEPHAKGHIIISRGRRDLPGLNYRHGFMVKHYLVDVRGIAPERFAVVDGGVKSCMSVELWLVPSGAPPPAIRNTYGRSSAETFATFKYDEHDYLLPIDQVAYDLYNSGAKGVAPEMLGGYAEALRNKPDARAYLIAYEQYCRDECTSGVTLRDRRGTAERMLKHEKEVLTSRYGIGPSRIVTVKGGHRRYRQVELWIVPKGSDVPAPGPTVIPPESRKR